MGDHVYFRLVVCGYGRTDEEVPASMAGQPQAPGISPHLQAPTLHQVNLRLSSCQCLAIAMEDSLRHSESGGSLKQEHPPYGAFLEASRQPRPVRASVASTNQISLFLLMPNGVRGQARGLY